MSPADKLGTDIYDMAPGEHHDGGDVPLSRMSDALRRMMSLGVSKATGAQGAEKMSPIPLMVLGYTRIKDFYRLWIEDEVGRGGQGDMPIEAAEIAAEQSRAAAKLAESEARTLKEIAKETPTGRGLEGQERMDAMDKSRQAIEAADIAEARAVTLRLLADDATRKARAACPPSDRVFEILLVRAIFAYTDQTRVSRADIEAALGLAPRAARTPGEETGEE